METTKEFFYLLGLFAGDGWFQSRGISIGTKHRKDAKKIADIMKRLFGREPKFKKRIFKDGHTLYIVSFYSVEIEKNFRKLLGFPSKNKSKNFQFPKRSKLLSRQFIRGLFDAEAYEYLWRNKPRIGFEICNENVAKKVYDLIRADKISCSLSRCSDGANRIDITGKQNVANFNFLYGWLAPESPSSK